MTKRVQRYGLAAGAMAALAGLAREVIINTTRNSVHVHDGVTLGGFEQMRADGTNGSLASGGAQGLLSSTFWSLLNSIGSVPISIPNGGTGSTTAGGARTNLGLAIGSNVEAWSPVLDTLAAAATPGQEMVVNSAGVPSMAGPLHGVKNKFINGACAVAQRAGNGTLTVNLATTPAYGTVDRFSMWASGGAVTGGTIIQDTASPVGRTGKALKFNNYTLTGAGVLSAKQRIESINAVDLKNQNASFQVEVYHDTGVNVNFQITIRKPNAADNYAGTTQIAQSGLTSVASGTPTLLKFENQALGDCSFGLEIEVTAAVGAVAGKNVWMTEWQIEEGPICTAFERRPYQQDLLLCQRYAELITDYSDQRTNPFAGAGGTITATVWFATMKRATPTASLIGTASLSGTSPGVSSVSLGTVLKTGVVLTGPGNSSGVASMVTFAVVPGTGGIYLTAEL